jgi:hypothetical protein
MPLPTDSATSSVALTLICSLKAQVRFFVTDYRKIRERVYPPEEEVLRSLNLLADTIDEIIMERAPSSDEILGAYRRKIQSIVVLRPQDDFYEETVVVRRPLLFGAPETKTTRFPMTLGKEMDILIEELNEKYRDTVAEEALAVAVPRAPIDVEAMSAQIITRVTSQLQAEMEAQKEKKFEEGRTAGAKENMALVRAKFTEFMNEPAVATALRAMKSGKGFLALMEVGDDAPAQAASDEPKASSAAFFPSPSFASDQLKKLLTPRKYQLVMALSRSVTKSTDLRPDDIQISLAKLLIARLTLHCCDRSAVEIVNELIDVLARKIDRQKEELLSMFPQLATVINFFLADSPEESLDTLSSEDYAKKLKALRDIVKVEWADFLADGSAANCLMREALVKNGRSLESADSAAYKDKTEEEYVQRVMAAVCEWSSKKCRGASSANPNP